MRKDTIKLLKSVKTDGAVVDPIAIPCDLGFDEECQHVIDVVAKKDCQFDILVNKRRGAARRGKHRRSGARHALKHMKEGSCIITTSVTAFKGNAPVLDYSSTNGAILAFTRGLPHQLVKRGIRVNGKRMGYSISCK